MSPEVHEALLKHREAFRKKFGRDPGPEDPVFFDPSADTPQPLDMEEGEAGIIEGMVAVGIDPAIIYVYRKTGLMVSEENRELIPEEDLDEWAAALAEYEELIKRKPS